MYRRAAESRSDASADVVRVGALPPLLRVYSRRLLGGSINSKIHPTGRDREQYDVTAGLKSGEIDSVLAACQTRN